MYLENDLKMCILILPLKKCSTSEIMNVKEGELGIVMTTLKSYEELNK